MNGPHQLHPRLLPVTLWSRGFAELAMKASAVSVDEETHRAARWFAALHEAKDFRAREPVSRKDCPDPMAATG